MPGAPGIPLTPGEPGGPDIPSSPGRPWTPRTGVIGWADALYTGRLGIGTKPEISNNQPTPEVILKS